jgi:CheY-like chemotaxis protein
MVWLLLDAARANPPDVILVDIGLLGIDGYEVARRVRLEPALKDVLLVALTGYGRMRIDRIRWRPDSTITCQTDQT